MDDDMIGEDIPLDDFDDLEDEMEDDLNLTNQSSEKTDKKMTKR